MRNVPETGNRKGNELGEWLASVAAQVRDSHQPHGRFIFILRTLAVDDGVLSA